MIQCIDFFDASVFNVGLLATPSAMADRLAPSIALIKRRPNTATAKTATAKAASMPATRNRPDGVMGCRIDRADWR